MNDDKIPEKDLIFDMSSNTVELIKDGIISPEVLNVRDIVNDIDVEKLDEYSDSLLYKAYYVAKRKRTSSPSILSKELKISRKLFEYYLTKYPKLGTVIQMGLMDAREEMKGTIVDSLFKAATGQTVVETSTATETMYDNEGGIIGSKEKVTEVNKVIPPNVQAGLELMRKLDPSWVPNVKVDVNTTENKTLHVIEDVNVAVDYRKLSPEALRELIGSNKLIGSHDAQINQLEDGNSVKSLKTYPVEEIQEIDGTPQKVIVRKKENPRPKKNIEYKTRKHKTRLMLQTQDKLVQRVKAQAKKEADKSVKGDI